MIELYDMVEYEGDTWEVTWLQDGEAQIRNTFGGSMFVDVDELEKKC